MNEYKNMEFDQERALYGTDGILVSGCRFDGPADGESALKESRNIRVEDCLFNLRYPFWHDENLKIDGCEMTPNCRAALWYTENVMIRNTKMHGIKALRECADVTVADSDIISPEFGWSVRGITMKNTSVESEYFMISVSLKGKYSFQYITDSVFENCRFDTKDAFWHARNVTVRNSVIKGEYLAWYCENVTFENCTIIGTQPLCYCKGLRLINCRMENADLCFEKSEVEADIVTPVDSIKNPRAGRITVPAVGELIMDDPEAKGEVIVG